MILYPVLLLLFSSPSSYRCVSIENLFKEPSFSGLETVFQEEFFHCSDEMPSSPFLFVYDKTERSNYLVFSCSGEPCFYSIKLIPPKMIGEVLDFIQGFEEKRDHPIYLDIQNNEVWTGAEAMAGMPSHLTKKISDNSYINDEDLILVFNKKQESGSLLYFSHSNGSAALETIDFPLKKEVSLPSPPPNLRVIFLPQLLGVGHEGFLQSVGENLILKFHSGYEFVEYSPTQKTWLQDAAGFEIEYQVSFSGLNAIEFILGGDNDLFFVHKDKVVKGFRAIIHYPMETIRVVAPIGKGVEPLGSEINFHTSDISASDFTKESNKIIESLKNRHVDVSEAFYKGALGEDKIQVYRDLGNAVYTNKRRRQREREKINSSIDTVYKFNKDLWQLWSRCKILEDFITHKETLPIEINVFFPISQAAQRFPSQAHTIEGYIEHYFKTVQSGILNPKLNYFYHRVNDANIGLSFQIVNPVGEQLKCQLSNPQFDIDSTISSTIMDFEYVE